MYNCDVNPVAGSSKSISTAKVVLPGKESEVIAPNDGDARYPKPKIGYPDTSVPTVITASNRITSEFPVENLAAKDIRQNLLKVWRTNTPYCCGM